MPTTHSHKSDDKFWLDPEWGFLYTHDRLLNTDGEVPEWGHMTNSELVDTYELMTQDDQAVPMDLKVEMDTRGLLIFAHG